MKVLRTPEKYFENLKDFNFAPNYLTIPFQGHQLHMHYLDEGSNQEEVVLLLHGEPTWSYLYRHMITPLVDGGKRVIAPDLIGFGKSDKLIKAEHYSYENHVAWVQCLIEALDLKNIILFAQDWGGLIGLRILAHHQDRFSGLVISNSDLPVGQGATEGFMQWLAFSQQVENFNCGKIVNQGSMKALDADEIAAYNAPFPDESYKVGPRVFPRLFPLIASDPEAQENMLAWEKLRGFSRPTITVFGTHDEAFIGAEKNFIDNVPGAKDRMHQIINAGHFSQENQPQALVEAILTI